MSKRRIGWELTHYITILPRLTIYPPGYYPNSTLCLNFAFLWLRIVFDTGIFFGKEKYRDLSYGVEYYPEYRGEYAGIRWELCHNFNLPRGCGIDVLPFLWYSRSYQQDHVHIGWLTRTLLLHESFGRRIGYTPSRRRRSRSNARLYEEARTLRYDVIFKRDYGFEAHNDHVVIASGLPSLREARKHRKVSGDVVVYAGTTETVKSPRWLWRWERSNPDSYAYRQVQHA